MKKVLIILFLVLIKLVNSSNPIIIIIQSDNILPYNQAYNGLYKELKLSKIINNNSRIYRFILSSSTTNNQKIKTQVNYLLKRKLASLIVSIGTRAVKMILNERWFKKHYVVFCMVGKYKNLKLDSYNKNITGISLEINPKIQLEFLKEILPQHKKVGLLYDVKNDLAFAKHSQLVAKFMNIEIIEFPVKKLEDIPLIYNKIFNQVNVLWLIPSARIFGRVIIEKIIHNAIIHRIPVFGPSKFLAEKGAFFSLSPDWFDIGRQTGELIKNILETKPNNLSKFKIEEPKKVKVIINLKITEFLGYKIPPKWMDRVEFFPPVKGE